MSDLRIQTLISELSSYEKSARREVPSMTSASARWPELALGLARGLAFSREDTRRVFGDYVASRLQGEGSSVRAREFEDDEILEAVSAVVEMRQRINEAWLNSIGLLLLPIGEMNPDEAQIIGGIIRNAVRSLIDSIPVSRSYRELHTPFFQVCP
jgi:hypothetical protein